MSRESPDWVVRRGTCCGWASKSACRCERWKSLSICAAPRRALRRARRCLAEEPRQDVVLLPCHPGGRRETDEGELIRVAKVQHAREVVWPRAAAVAGDARHTIPRASPAACPRPHRGDTVSVLRRRRRAQVARLQLRVVAHHDLVHLPVGHGCQADMRLRGSVALLGAAGPRVRTETWSCRRSCEPSSALAVELDGDGVHQAPIPELTPPSAAPPAPGAHIEQEKPASARRRAPPRAARRRSRRRRAPRRTCAGSAQSPCPSPPCRSATGR